MSGTGEDPIPGFPAIGDYVLVPGPGEPGYEVSEHADPDEDYIPSPDPPEEEDPEEDGGPSETEPDPDVLEAHGEDLEDDEEPIDPDDDEPYEDSD